VSVKKVKKNPEPMFQVHNKKLKHNGRFSGFPKARHNPGKAVAPFPFAKFSFHRIPVFAILPLQMLLFLQLRLWEPSQPGAA
jgi:hypothetical protein